MQEEQFISRKDHLKMNTNNAFLWMHAEEKQKGVKTVHGRDIIPQGKLSEVLLMWMQTRQYMGKVTASW